MVQIIPISLGICITAAAIRTAAGTLSFKLYENAALAYVPVKQGRTDSAAVSLEEKNLNGEDVRCYLSGELAGTLKFASPDVVIHFDCQFRNTATGFVWIDGHLVCDDQNSFRPSDRGRDNPLHITGTLPFRAHIMSNDTSCDNPGRLEIFWKEVNGLDTEYQMLRDDMEVSLDPQLPLFEAKRDNLQRTLGYGWGSWLRHDMRSIVKLPEGLVLTPKLCFRGECLEFATPESNFIRVGLHAYDRSYVTYSMAHQGANVTVKYSVQEGHRLYVTITPTVLPSQGYEIELFGRYAWYRPGGLNLTTDPSGNQQLTFRTPGFGSVNVSVACSAPSLGGTCISAPTKARKLKQTEGSNEEVVLSIPLITENEPVAFLVNTTGRVTTQDVVNMIQINKESEEMRIRRKFGDSKYAVPVAIQSAVMWTLIFNPVENQGLLMPVSRMEAWSARAQSNAATTDWTYVIFDWDNFFASLMAGLDRKEVAYSNLFQVVKAKTAAGFVPNFATGGFKSQDRTEPTIGAKVMLELFRKYKEKWPIEVVFDDLLDWNDWFVKNRILQPEGLVALGSHIDALPSRDSMEAREALAEEDLRAAKWESGMDNSPMYDEAIFDTESHLMQLYDVGMSSLFAQEAYSLAKLAKVIGRDVTLIQKLQARGDAMREKIKNTLWDPEHKVFANRFLNGTFSDRISPTSFYPLLIGAASEEQAENMLQGWLLNGTRFCISTHGNFDGNDPNGCYYGLPSISADDPAYMAEGENHYWRGLVWGPSAQIVYWSLHEASRRSRHRPAWMLARQALCQQMEALFMRHWNAHAHVCENYHPSLTGREDCSGTAFYHWGALTGLIGMVEGGYW